MVDQSNVEASHPFSPSADTASMTPLMALLSGSQGVSPAYGSQNGRSRGRAGGDLPSRTVAHLLQ